MHPHQVVALRQVQGQVVALRQGQVVALRQVQGQVVALRQGQGQVVAVWQVHGAGCGSTAGAGAGRGCMTGAGAVRGCMIGAGAGRGCMTGAGAGHGWMTGAGAGRGCMTGAGAGCGSTTGAGAGCSSTTGAGAGRGSTTGAGAGRGCMTGAGAWGLGDTKSCSEATRIFFYARPLLLLLLDLHICLLEDYKKIGLSLIQLTHLQGWDEYYMYYSGTCFAQNGKHKYTKNTVLEFHSSTDFPVLALVCSVLPQPYSSPPSAAYLRQWTGAPCHYLNQCWVIVNWTHRNKLRWF